MGEAMRAVGVVRVRGQGLLDLLPSQRELSILGQPHRMIGKEPIIVAVMWGEAVHQRRDLVFLSDVGRARRSRRWGSRHWRRPARRAAMPPDGRITRRS